MPIYYLNDDVLMRSILSGAYTGTPDGHAVYMKYPLTYIMSILYRMLPRVPWFSILLVGSIVLAVFWMMESAQKKKSTNFFLLLGGLLTLVLPSIFLLHYTIVAAILVGGGVYLAVHQGKTYQLLILLTLSFLVRSQVFYLGIPFLLVAILWNKINKKSLYFLLSLVACIGICGSIHWFAYGSLEWKDYRDYNQVRTDLYDYTNFLSTEEYRKHLDELDLSENQYEILQSYNTILDNSLEEEVLQQVTQGIHKLSSIENTGNILSLIREYIQKIRYQGRPYNYIWFLLFLLVILLTIYHRLWKKTMLLFCLVIGRSMIWMYLIYQGRFPERVIMSLYYIEILLLLGLATSFLNQIRNNMEELEKNRLKKYGILLGTSMVLLLGFLQIKNTVKEYKYYTNLNAEWNIVREYLNQNKENLYLFDVFSVVAYAGVFWEEEVSNGLMAGGWLTKSPLVKTVLANKQAEDGGELLYYNEGVYFVAESTKELDYLEEYFSDRFGSVTLQVVDAIWCSSEKEFKIYQITP